MLFLIFVGEVTFLVSCVWEVVNPHIDTKLTQPAHSSQMESSEM